MAATNGGGNVASALTVGSPHHVDEAITDLQLINLAQDIGPESWRIVGLGLGFREPELAHIEANHRGNMTDGTYQMLIRWRRDQTDASIALYQLRQALVNAKLGALVRQLNRASTINLNNVGREDLVFDVGNNIDGFDVRQLRRELERTYHSHLGTARLIPWDSRSRVAVDRYFTEADISLEDTSVRNRVKVPLENNRHDIFTIGAKKNLPRKRILLQGRPGSGKSTLVAKLAFDWMSRHPKSPLKDFPLMFVLSLQKLDEGSNLGDAVKRHLLPEDSTFTEESIETFVRSNPNSSIIILDGLHELVKGDPKKGKVGNLMKLIENRQFTECTVMVTARQSKVAQMKESTVREYTLMEIKEFKVEDIFSYILTFFQDDEAMAQGLIRHIEATPVVLDSLCSFPLFCAIVCHLWENNMGSSKNGERLGTNTELTNHILKSLWSHHASKHAEDEEGDEIDGGLASTESVSAVNLHETRFAFRPQSFSWLRKRVTRKRSQKRGLRSELPTDSLSDTICKLGRVALEKVMAQDDDLAFQPKDLAICRGYTEIGLAVGILSYEQVASTGNLRLDALKGNQTCIKFFHLEIMQKCAAVYLASLWKIKNHVKFTDVLKQLKDKFVVEEYDVVLMLACGEDARVAKEILQHLASVSASHDIILKCYFESPSDKAVDEEMNRIFQCKYYVALQSPTAHTLSALNYFLEKSTSEENMTIVIEKLLISAAPPSSIERLVEVLAAENCPKLSTMSLAWCDLESANTPALLLALGRLPALTDLTMTGTTVGPTFIENIVRLPPGCFDSLTCLELPIGTTCADEVLRATFWSGQFQALNKVSLTVQDVCSDGTLHRSDEESQNNLPTNQLRKLTLFLSSLAEEASARFADTLTHAKSLKSLAIINSTFHRSFFSRLVEMTAVRKILLHVETWKDFELETFLTRCPLVCHIEVNSSSSSSIEGIHQTIEILSRVIPNMPQLNTLQVSVRLGSAYSPRDETMKALCVSIKECAMLNRLVFSGIKLTAEQGVEIIKTCRAASVRIICLLSCFSPGQDLTDFKRVRAEISQGKSMVIEYG